MDRNTAFEILNKYTKNKNLVNHGIAVEGAMRHFASIYGEDENYWGNIGLLHDVDYEMYPEEHLQHTEELLKPFGATDDEIHAINSHGWGICSDVEPEKQMEKILFAADELTGLIVACALVTPDKKLENVTVESVLKKWKKKDPAPYRRRAFFHLMICPLPAASSLDGNGLLCLYCLSVLLRDADA